MKLDKYLMQEGRERPEQFTRVTDEYRKSAKEIYLEIEGGLPFMVKYCLKATNSFDQWDKNRNGIDSFTFSGQIRGMLWAGEYIARSMIIGIPMAVGNLLGFPYGPDVLREAERIRRELNAQNCPKKA